ncbi:pentapeptide repeat-containing protein [Nostoc sp.]|uniref:pentapeptide repeat-containing protein n=1 Tax=Nostoc sp. TaxID=1180 RepID=UPI002FF77F50
MNVKRQSITVEELLRRYAAGEKNFVGIEFSYSDKGLRGCNLSGINLSDSKIAVYMADVNLSGADLSRVYMPQTNLDRANLSSANLSGAILCLVPSLRLGMPMGGSASLAGGSAAMSSISSQRLETRFEKGFNLS